ncbi:ABC transporter permease [soil metagenome]
MNGLAKVRLVAWRELKARGATKTFMISTVITALGLVAAVVLPTVFGGSGSSYEVGLVGEGGESIIATATALAEQRATDEAESDEFVTTEYGSVEEAEAALEAGDVEAVIVNGEELVVASSGVWGSSMSGFLQEAAGTRRVQELVAEDESAAEVLALLGSEPLATRSLDGEDADRAAIRGAVAFAGMFLMYIAVLMYGSWMMSAVTEEKTNRVVEILLSALKPWQIFAGKLVGIGTLGTLQMGFMVLTGAFALAVSGLVEVPRLPIDSVIALVGWFVLGFLLYATLFGAAGSLVSKMENAQAAAAPLSILAVGGYLVSFVALGDPNGMVAVVATFFPFTAPYVAPIRLALDQIAVWEMAASVLITFLTILIMVRLAGRVYEGGVLRFGGRVKWREAFRSAD